MAITLFSGTPGSYKSYHAVQECISALSHGKNLITNFPINYKKRLKRPIKGTYECVNNIDLTVDYLIDFAVSHHKQSIRAQTLLVVDEASIKFNSRDFQLKDRMSWINFFANHRHFNYDVILIAQQDRMLDRQIRGLIETEYKHRAIKNYKFLGFLINLICRGCFVAVEYWYPCKLRNSSKLCVFNRRIAACYDTMGLFVDSGNKMSLHRSQRDSKEMKINEVNDKAVKEQVYNDLSKLATVLYSYVLRSF